MWLKWLGLADNGSRRRPPGFFLIAYIIHDSDLLDEKFGRREGFGIDGVLKGWASRGMRDSEILARGIQLIEALHAAVSGK